MATPLTVLTPPRLFPPPSTHTHIHPHTQVRSLFWVYLTVMLALLVAYLFEIITWLILGERAAGWGSRRGEGGAAEQEAVWGGRCSREG